MSPYLNVAVYAAFLFLTSFIVIVSKLHVRILDGIHTYIHPENVGGGPQGNVRAAIRRPEPERRSELDGYTNLASSRNPDSQMPTNQTHNNHGSHKRKDRWKEKTGFDEANAQIFRLRLSEDHLRTRVYFTECKEAVLHSCLGFSCFVVHHFLPLSAKSEGTSVAHLLFEGSMVPILLGFFSVCKLSVLLVKISFERSASKRSEKQMSVFCGILGFLIAVVILSMRNPALFYSKFDYVGDGGADVEESKRHLQIGFSNFFLAFYAGCMAGFLYIPACRAARSFWLGTDQLHWDLSVISCGKMARVFLYINLLTSIFTALLWTKPMVMVLASSEQGMPVPVDNSGSLSSLDDSPVTGYTDILFFKNQNGDLDAEDPILTDTAKLRNLEVKKQYLDERWVREIGMHPATFAKFRLWCLLVSSIMQLLLLRRNVQMYLNEAVLSWYQRLHTSKVPDLDFSRAKLFLHNHYICQVLLQFLIPPTLLLLFIGLSQVKGSFLAALPFIHSLMHDSSLIKEATLFMAWWILFVWSVFTFLSIGLHRFGIISVS